MKKGFTLIELLAVIVILAVIALIATPMILGVIDSAKKGAAENSTYGYVDAIEKTEFQDMIDAGINNTKKDGIYDLTTIGKVKYKGKAPVAVCITLKDGNVNSGLFQFDSYVVEYKNDKAKVSDELKRVECNTSEDSLSFNSTKGVNAPKLSKGMTPIKWVDGVETVTTSDDPEWYDYKNNLWANVKTADGSYWVWIPRYAYKINSGYHSKQGDIYGKATEIKFLIGTTDTTADNTKIETSGYVAGVNDTSMHYFTHPAFQNDINKIGYWVAKFEPTAAEGVANVPPTSGCSKSDDDVITKTIKVVPNSSSWRCISISNAYKAIASMKTKLDGTGNNLYGWTSDEVDPHLMTGLEWGATYYLTLSVYGASINGSNTKIHINNSETYTTGCAGNTVSAVYYNGCQNKYNTSVGVKASTTKNITGIYDMSGGANDRTMAVYNELPKTSGFTVTDIKNMPAKYITRYETPSQNMLNGVGMDYDATVYGDAIYEIGSGASRFNGSMSTGTAAGGGTWYDDFQQLPDTSSPWIVRGGSNTSSTSAGLGTIGTSYGQANSGETFRPVLSVVK